MSLLTLVLPAEEGSYFRLSLLNRYFETHHHVQVVLFIPSRRRRRVPSWEPSGYSTGSRSQGTVCISDLRVQYVISDLRVQYQGVRETSTENQGTVCIPDLRVQYVFTISGYSTCYDIMYMFMYMFMYVLHVMYIMYVCICIYYVLYPEIVNTYCTLRSGIHTVP